ncbi:MAG: hydroxyacylglutathione hydrolase, partial [Woeseia sp.]|nr:hydroxyacylglutathione hydrolase [Woeseia sp.]
LLEQYANQNPDDALVTTMGMEMEINTFFRLQSPSVIAKLNEQFPKLGDSPSPREVFLKLRELRNNW